MPKLTREFRFLSALWQANLQAAMEYRVAFLTQVLGMMLNNAIYFIFWIIFFDRFPTVRGWGLQDMLLLYGLVAAAFGLASFFFGNMLSLAQIIADGRLDYYLSLPRPVLIHALASGSVASGMGDLVYGLTSFALAGYFTPDGIGRFILGVLFAALLFIAVFVIAHSAAFWLGNATVLTSQVFMAMVTFAIYPINMFEGPAKLLLFTLLPAALVGSVPAEFVRSFSWMALGELVVAAFIFVGLAVWVFHRGLRRYESGSAIQTQV